MADVVQTVAFEGGELRLLDPGSKDREAVLALPLSRLIVKMIRVPEEDRADPSAYATPILQAMSPYPDEALTVGCETMRETERGLIVLAAALPESAADDIAEALDAAKLNVTRIDALALGTLRGAWSALAIGDGEDASARRLLLIGGPDCISIVVLDGDAPSAVRAVGAASDLRREVMLSLLEAEDFGGTRPLKETVVLGDVATEGVEAFAPVRRVEVGEDAALVGVADRSQEESSLNALPESWREVLEDARFKAKLTRNISVAGGIWALIMLVLFGVPVAYGFLTDHQRALCKEHSRQYRAVAAMRDKVKLVQKYSDHARGALEIMKAVSDRLPQGITLTSWTYRRDEGVKVSGEADEAELVYRFKDNMAEAGTEAEDDDPVFAKVLLNGPSAGRGGKQKFDLECGYEGEEEE
jgi:hypothetical protein